MPMKKNPHKHNKPTIDPKTKLALDTKFRKENEKARIAGKEYGALCMGMIALMATIACSEIPKIRKYMIAASEVLHKDIYMTLTDIIDEVNKKMDSSVTTDQIVDADPTFARFF